MQIFGLISILIAVSIGAVWMVSSMGGGQVGQEGPGNVPTKSNYQEAIDSAHDVVDVMEDTAPMKDQIPETTPTPVSDSTTGKSVVVYDGISVPDNTTVLNLSGRALSGSLKAEIRHLSNLRELNISNNNFTGLPAEVGQLTRLEVLNLANNPFTGLPYELGNLKNLKVLDLRGTNYAEQDLEIIKQSLPSSVQILTD